MGGVGQLQLLQARTGENRFITDESGNIRQEQTVIVREESMGIYLEESVNISRVESVRFADTQ